MKKMTINIVIDVLLLVAMTIISVSGFLLNGILPHCHGGGGVVRSVLGMGRHAWADIHLISGIILVVLLALHIILHWSQVDGFFRKQIKSVALRYTLYAVLLVLLLATVLPWIFAL